MWGGRFAAQPADAMQAINASIDIDMRLWREDIEGSKAHADMLGAADKEARLAVERDPDLKSERGQAIRLVLRLFGYADAAELARSG